MRKGIIIKSTGKWYTVKDKNNNITECSVKGNFRIKDIKSTNPVVVGDIVDYEIIKDQSVKNRGIITNIHDRKNYIIRKSQNLSKKSQIIAANIDQAFLICTIKHPVTTTIFIDRFLASAEAYRIPVILIFNKIDLYNNDDKKKLGKLNTIYENVGYQCINTSIIDKTGLDILKKTMTNKINVFNGHSGVGKTTIINYLNPGIGLKTKEISDYHKTGKHTTTYTEMFELDFGGYIIDTPGIKGFGMTNMESWEISHYFPEIFKISKECQYNNCSHTHEPGCAVKKAVIDYKIAESRYISYLSLLENDEKYRPAF